MERRVFVLILVVLTLIVASVSIFISGRLESGEEITKSMNQNSNQANVVFVNSTIVNIVGNGKTLTIVANNSSPFQLYIRGNNNYIQVINGILYIYIKGDNDEVLIENSYVKGGRSTEVTITS
jgi:hypothetical protein